MKTLTRDELKEMNDEEHEDFVLINVLPQDAFNEQHIRTSINLPYEADDFEDAAERIAGSKTRKIVVYCASFDCDASEKAAEKLEESGFTNIFDYEGGTKDWFEQKTQMEAA